MNFHEHGKLIDFETSSNFTKGFNLKDEIIKSLSLDKMRVTCLQMAISHVHMSFLEVLMTESSVSVPVLK